MTQAIAGEYYSYAGSTEKKIMFCPEGTFFDSSESSYSGTGTDSLGNQTMAWGNASQNQGIGQWAIQGNAQSGTITLVYKSSKKVQVKYQAGPEKGCYSSTERLSATAARPGAGDAESPVSLEEGDEREDGSLALYFVGRLHGRIGLDISDRENRDGRRAIGE